MDMKTVSVTEFRRNASDFFSDVENGQKVVVLRHGKPIAQITPVRPDSSESPSWRQSGLRLAVRGASLSYAILEDRDRADLF